MTLSRTSGQLLARWGTRDEVMPWQSWTETLLSIGATSDNWGRGQYGYDSKYQGVDTNHLYQHWRLRLWPVILPIWLKKNKKVNKNKLYTTAFTNQCFKCSNIHNLTKWLHITHYLHTHSYLLSIPHFACKLYPHTVTLCYNDHDIIYIQINDSHDFFLIILIQCLL